MGPLWRGGALVPPHAKGALGIAAVPNQGPSLPPEARQGLVSLKAMRRDSPPQELGAKFSWESEWLSPGRGTSLGRVPRGHRDPGRALARLHARIQGLPAPSGTTRPPRDHAAPPRTECLKPL